MTGTALHATTTLLNAIPNADGTFNLQANVGPAVGAGATGTMTFTQAGTTIGTATVINGVATLNSVTMPSASSTLYAVYGGDSRYGSSSGQFNPAPLAVTFNLSTGLSTTGTTLSAGSVDPRYTITATPSGPVTNSALVTQSGWPFGPWTNDSSTSQWISPHTNENALSGGTKEPAGNFTYTTTFSLAGLNPATAQIFGQMEGDNTITQILLNGTPVSYTSSGQNDYVAFQPLSITSGFQAGTNTLSFVVNNVAISNPQNAAGFRAQLTAMATPIAETTTTLNSSVSGSSVTLTGTVVSVTSGVPDGTVTFKEGTTTIGTGTLNSSGVATFTTSSLSAGLHAITAVYGGSVNFLASASPLRQYDPLSNNQLSQALDLDNSPGTSASGNVALAYNSANVNVRPIIKDSVWTDPSRPLPSSILINLYDSSNNLVGSTNISPLTGYVPGNAIPFSVQVTSALPTGVFQYKIAVSYPSNPELTPFNIFGQTFVLSSDKSAFGAGWSFTGADRLYAIPAESANNVSPGVVRVYGDGSWDYYPSITATTYSNPSGDFGTLTGSAASGWTYKTPDGQTTNFDGSGRQTLWTSADGYETLGLTYNIADGTINTYTAIDGTVSTFNYSGGQATNITTLGRTVSFTFGPSGGNLTAITNPDGRVRRFGYDSNHHLTSDRLGSSGDPGTVYTSWVYGTNGLLTSRTDGEGAAAGTTQIASPSFYAFGSTLAPNTWETDTDPLMRVTQTQYDWKMRVLETINPDGGTEILTRNANGLVTDDLDPMLRDTSYTYDIATGYVLTTTLPGGFTTTNTYTSDSYHSLATSIDERGVETNYTSYDRGHPTTVIEAYGDPDQTETQYTYSAGLLSQELNGDAVVVRQYGYDSNRRKISETDYTSGTTSTNQSWTYDSNGNVAMYTDNRGTLTNYTNDALGRVLGQTTTGTGSAPVSESWTFDVAGMQNGHTDGRGIQDTESHDSQGNMTSETVAVGTTAAATTTMTNDAAGQQKTVTDPNGHPQTEAYSADGEEDGTTDADGYTTQEIDNLDGEVTASKDGKGGWSYFSFDLLGRVLTETDSAGVVTTYTYLGGTGKVATQTVGGKTTTYFYDDLNREIKVTDPAGKSSYTSYDENGNVATTTDARGIVTKYLYDEQNQQIGVIEDYGGVEQRSDSEVLDADGEVTSSTNAAGETTSETYDDLGRVLTSTTAAGTTSYSYDLDGNVATMTDPKGKITSYLYDAQNRVIQTNDPDGHVTYNTYDTIGNTLTSANSAGTTTNTYDANNWLLTSQAPDGGVTTYTHDGNGNTLTIKDPVNNTTTFTYDGDNRVTLKTDPLGATTTTVYNTDGSIASTTDRLGRTKTFSYDGDLRLTQEVWKDASGTIVDTLNYSYDNNGNLLTASNNAGSYTFTYDDLDQVVTVTDPNGITLTYGHDLAGNVTSILDSLGGQVTSTFDGSNRLTSRSLTGVSNPLSATFGYNSDSQLTSIQRYNDGVFGTSAGSTALGYDDAGNLTSETHSFTGGSVAYTNTFDAANRITSEVRADSTGTTTTPYSYNANSEVTTAGTTNYSYDLNGNRTGGSNTTVDNQLTNDGTFTYSYDAERNLIGRSNIATGASWTYTYNLNNLLLSAVQKDNTGAVLQTVTYVYDPFGDMLSETVTPTVGPAAVTAWVHDVTGATTGINQQANPVVMQLDGSGAVIERFLFDANGNALARSGTTTTATAWLLTDRLGSVRDVLDESGNLQDTITYDAFGNITGETNTTWTGKLAFTGFVYSNATGLYFAQNRAYLPSLGQWISQDPTGLNAGPNPSEYAGNNGANAVDPSGLEDIPQSYTESESYQAVFERIQIPEGPYPKGKFPEYVDIYVSQYSRKSGFTNRLVLSDDDVASLKTLQENAELSIKAHDAEINKFLKAIDEVKVDPNLEFAQQAGLIVGLRGRISDEKDKIAEHRKFIAEVDDDIKYRNGHEFVKWLEDSWTLDGVKKYRVFLTAKEAKRLALAPGVNLNGEEGWELATKIASNIAGPGQQIETVDSGLVFLGGILLPPVETQFDGIQPVVRKGVLTQKLQPDIDGASVPYSDWPYSWNLKK